MARFALQVGSHATTVVCGAPSAEALHGYRWCGFVSAAKVYRVPSMRKLSVTALQLREAGSSEYMASDTEALVTLKCCRYHFRDVPHPVLNIVDPTWSSFAIARAALYELYNGTMLDPIAPELAVIEKVVADAFMAGREAALAEVLAGRAQR